MFLKTDQQKNFDQLMFVSTLPHFICLYLEDRALMFFFFIAWNIYYDMDHLYHDPKVLTNNQGNQKAY